MTLINVSSIDVSITSLRRMADRVDDVARRLDAGHRELVLVGRPGWSTAAAGDRTGAASALAHTGEQWVGFLTRLQATLSRTADDLRGAGDGYADADQQAGLPYQRRWSA